MSYIDPITGGADMSITFKQREHAKILVSNLSCGKIFCSWFGESVFFFKKDLEMIKYLLPLNNGDGGCFWEIKTVKYMSIEDAIDRTINP